MISCRTNQQTTAVSRGEIQFAGLIDCDECGPDMPLSAKYLVRLPLKVLRRALPKQPYSEFLAKCEEICPTESGDGEVWRFSHNDGASSVFELLLRETDYWDECESCEGWGDDEKDKPCQECDGDGKRLYSGTVTLIGTITIAHDLSTCSVDITTNPGDLRVINYGYS